MMAAVKVIKASWISSRISQRMCRRRNQCSRRSPVRLSTGVLPATCYGSCSSLGCPVTRKSARWQLTRPVCWFVIRVGPLVFPVTGWADRGGCEAVSWGDCGVFGRVLLGGLRCDWR
jgi:hypothetical protein